MRIRSIHLFFAFLIGFLLFSCGAGRQASYTGRMDAATAAKAKDYYLSGALLDFEDQYRDALGEYRKALALDTASAQIMKAIGRNYFRLKDYKKSIRYLDKSYQKNKTDKETLFYLADAYFQQNDHEMATQYYAELNKLDPINPDVHSKLIYLYTRLGKTDELIALRENLVELLEGEEEFVYQLLTLYMQLNRFEKASNLIQDLLVKEPLEPENWATFGTILEMEGDTSGAINAYRKSLDLKTGNNKVMSRLYSLYQDREDWSGMVTAFEQVLIKDAESDRARLFIGEAYFYQENYERAKQMLTPLLKNEALKERAHLMMGQIAINQNLFDDAKAHLEELTALEPWNGKAWEFLAVLLYQEEKYEQCVRVLDKAIDALPQNASLLSLYANALRELGRFDEALPPSRQAYELAPGDLNIIISLGIVYNKLQMYKDLDSLYEAALRVYPGNETLLNNYSYSLGERGVRLDEAREMMAKVLVKHPENAAYLDTAGWIYYKLGDLDTALVYIEKAAAIDDSYAEILEHLGDIYFDLEQRDKARQYWQQASEKAPENNDLKKKIEQAR